MMGSCPTIGPGDRHANDPEALDTQTRDTCIVCMSLAFLKDQDLDLFRAQDRDPERAHEPFIESYKAL